MRVADEKKPGAGDVFTFDQVFGPDSTQESVYAVAVQPVVDQVVRGLSCCIFAYGQTGTGKTYTMLGDLADPYVDGGGRECVVLLAVELCVSCMADGCVPPIALLCS